MARLGGLASQRDASSALVSAHGGGLGTGSSSLKTSSQFHYDPADPTPNVGGAINTTLGRVTGPQDNRRLEAHPDVLIFTGLPIPQDTEVIGPVSAELYVSSSLRHTDFFVRLLDVTPSCQSLNICDGLLRVAPLRPVPIADRVLRVETVLFADGLSLPSRTVHAGPDFQWSVSHAIWERANL